ncbi:hypothetical protein ACB094_11G189400 [Castanea mollissima]
MAEGALFDVATGIIGKAGNLALQEIVLVWSVKDEIAKLGETVSTIKAVLLDAEAKQHNSEVSEAIKLWLKRLKDAMCDADDLLDEISTKALRREVMTRDKKAKEVRIFFSKSNQLAYGLVMGQKVKAMRERFDAIAADRNKFGLQECSRERQVRYKTREQTYSHVHAEAVIGREDDKKAIIRSLLDANIKENVSVLPIVGFGGLGKTTVAKLVFNDEQINNHFELKLWVCVSDNFDEKIIVEKIMECVKNKKPKDLEMNTLVNNLQKEINGKRYLLVLDDVWNENQEKWRRLKDILMGGARDSRILLTTRSEIVAKITQSVQLHKLKGLDETQSWSLFKKMAFIEGEEPKSASFENIGKEILKKCGGVPLAIRTIGGLLSLQKSEREWVSFKNNELLNISKKDDDILPTLKLSYDHLPSHLKQCFAFCSIFPKDYEIEKASLIYMWMAQGFINLYNENKCPEDVGDEYFMDLLWRSFFQEVELDELGNISTFKIHDLMHDIAIQVTGSGSTTIYSKEKDIDEKTRHMSFGHTIYSSSEIPISLSKARRIRTFLLPCQPKYNTIKLNDSISSEIIASFKFIRLLDMHNMGIKTISSSIKKLKHLRYLDLSKNEGIQMLPNSIVKLYNLQTLKLSRCENLKELPKDINKLVNLRFLEIDGCLGLTHMPNGLGQLRNLQTLSRFVMTKGRIDSMPRSSSELKELARLNELRGNLSIENLKHEKDAALEYKDANLKEKHRLDRLDLNWVDEATDETGAGYDDMSLEALQPHINLKALSLKHLNLKQLMERMMTNNKTSGNLPSIASSSSSSSPSTIVAPLSKLSFISLYEIEEALPEECLRNLISLRTLRLDNCPLPQGMRYLTALQRLEVKYSEVVDLSNDWDEMEWQGLRNLLELSVWSLPKLVSLPMGLQYVSSLQSLSIWNCRSLIAIPEWICKLISLQKLSIWDSPNLESLPKGIGALTSLQTLLILECPKLESLPEGFSALTSMRTLEIEGCPILQNRCKKQIGEDWHQISHIPNLDIEEPDEEEPNE